MTYYAVTYYIKVINSWPTFSPYL